jgi:hypothetical protein
MIRTRWLLAPFSLPVLLAPLWSQTQGLETSDREYLVSHLEFTRDLVAAAARGLSRAQWEFRPAPDRWTIAQCIDHLAKTEAYVVKAVRENLVTATGPVNMFNPGAKVEIKEPPRRMGPLEDGLIIRAMTDRVPATRIPASKRPVFSEFGPASSFEDLAKVVEEFERVRNATIEYVRTTKDDLRAHHTPASLSPFRKHFAYEDAYQWILRMSAHTERHLMQAQEVTRSAGYPSR